jgi:hypothetical protein
LANSLVDYLSSERSTKDGRPGLWLERESTAQEHRRRSEKVDRTAMSAPEAERPITRSRKTSTARSSLFRASCAPCYPSHIHSPAAQYVVYALIKPFISLCLLNANPQDLPASTPLLIITLGAYLLVTVVMAMPIYGLGLSILQAILEVALLLGYTRLALQVSRRPERYLQTASALAGTGVIIGVLALPLVYSLSRAAAYGDVNSLTLPAYLLILAWLLVVYGHIYRHALSTGLLIGMLVGFGYVVVSSVVIESVFAPPSFS